jgi:signal transduction histidine kinase
MASAEKAGHASVPRPRIRRRMALIVATATGIVILAFCLPLGFYVRANAYDRAVDDAQSQARALAAELASAADRAGVARIVRQGNAGSADRATAFLRAGSRIGAPVPAAVPRAVRAGRTAMTTAPDGGRLVWQPVRGRLAAWAVVVRVPRAVLTQGVAGTWALLFGAGAALVLVAVGLADRLGRSIVRPLQQLVTATNRLRDGDLRATARPAGPYEVAEVGQAVNELAARIDALLASARIAAADLGHRLRTPLTALRLDVEALGDESLTTEEVKGRLEADLDQLEQSVNLLIEQTRDAPEQRPARSDLAAAVRDRLAFWSVLARSQGRAADVHLPGRRVDVELRRDEADAAIDALLSNVFTHTPEGTRFSVRLGQAGRGAAGWSLVVENAAPSASSHSAPNGQSPAAGGTAKPAPAATKGTGLGLDIVRRTAERAGGAFTAGPLGSGGFRAELTVP